MARKSYNAFTGFFAGVRGLSTAIGVAGEGAEEFALLARDLLPEVIEQSKGTLSNILLAWAYANAQCGKMLEALEDEEDSVEESSDSLGALPLNKD